MRKNSFYTFFILVCLLCSSSYSLDSTGTANTAEEIGAPRGCVLIARRGSWYKTTVAKKVKKLLERQTVQVEIVDIKILKKKDTKKYDAIVVLNRVRAWHLNFHTRRFFRKVDQAEKKKIIMVTTALTSWKTRKKDIDAVTVASEETNINEVVRMIHTKIVALLELD